MSLEGGQYGLLGQMAWWWNMGLLSDNEFMRWADAYEGGQNRDTRPYVEPSDSDTSDTGWDHSTFWSAPLGATP